jgi:hypothetical protein
VKEDRIAIIHYSHKHGEDLIPVILKKGLPKITNRLLSKVGVWEPELEREDEFAEWFGPYKLEDIPTLTGPRDWSPRQIPPGNMLLTIISLYSHRDGLSAVPVLLPSGTKELPEITKELLEKVTDEDFDLENEDNVAGWITTGIVKELNKV